MAHFGKNQWKVKLINVGAGLLTVGIIIAVLYFSGFFFASVYQAHKNQQENKVAEIETESEKESDDLQTEESVEESSDLEESVVESEEQESYSEDVVSEIEETSTSKEEATSMKESETVEQKETEFVESAEDYILPGSDSRLISEEELRGLSDWQLKLARNEIYARHGRTFKSQELQDYFNGQSWYEGTIDPNDFQDSSMLNEIEKTNLETIMRVEDQLAGRVSGNDTQSNSEIGSGASQVEVNISNWGVTDITPYIENSNIESLVCYGNSLEDFTPIAKLMKLKTLDIANTGVSDLTVFEGLSQLENFYIGENSISDISVVQNFPNLRAIDFWYTEISDITMLSKMDKLEEVYMSYSNVNTLKPLMNLSKLQVLSIRGLTIPKKEYDEFVQKHPSCKIYKEGTKFI